MKLKVLFILICITAILAVSFSPARGALPRALNREIDVIYQELVDRTDDIQDDIYDIEDILSDIWNLGDDLDNMVDNYSRYDYAEFLENGEELAAAIDELDEAVSENRSDILPLGEDLLSLEYEYGDLLNEFCPGTRFPCCTFTPIYGPGGNLLNVIESCIYDGLDIAGDLAEATEDYTNAAYHYLDFMHGDLINSGYDGYLTDGLGELADKLRDGDWLDDIYNSWTGTCGGTCYELDEIDILNAYGEMFGEIGGLLESDAGRAYLDAGDNLGYLLEELECGLWDLCD